MKAKATAIGSFLICLLFSCKHKESEYHNLEEKITEKSKTYHGIDISSEAYINDYELVEISEGGHTFLIPERKSQIKSFSCTECHSRPLVGMQKDSRIQRAHWDVEMKHANASTMNCATCHNGNDMNHLKSLANDQVDFNMSYLLCAQCHSPQFEDWKGGAHGKNIGGWAKPRASMTCVNCHNPHQPQIPPKWPIRFNSQMEIERK
ncbi:cytochrome c3 family protein [Ulvibacterium sp.]|uniref:cytochrome c3 family protein n=1 Tax=Ulvibacterium sp. TaxID=2665914 RepID=UPI0026267320|nr:cytochrome c3 family protein [Ulvibacterium sp.]